MTMPPLLQNLAALGAKITGRDIVPVIVVRRPGQATLSILKAMAQEAGVEFLDVRCSMIDDDYRSVPVLKAGTIVYEPMSASWLRVRLQRGQGTMLVLDEAASGGMGTTAFLEQVDNEATGLVYVMLTASADEVDAVQAMVTQGLGMLPGEMRIHRVVDEEQMFRDAVAFARSHGTPADIVDFLDDRGDTVDLGMAKWIRYGPIITSGEIQSYGAAALEAIGRGMLGDRAFEAHRAWLAVRNRTGA